MSLDAKHPQIQHETDVFIFCKPCRNQWKVAVREMLLFTAVVAPFRFVLLVREAYFCIDSFARDET